MSAPALSRLIDGQGSLQPALLTALALVTRVNRSLLEACRIRPASGNWLRAPWYNPSHGGGAITLGRTIYFNRNWFWPAGEKARGDGSLESSWRWLGHLAHEVGHLPQAERYGLTLGGKVSYVAAFTGQYLWRALSLKGQVHDGAALEREADRGRWVLQRLVGAKPLAHPLVQAVHAGDAEAVKTWCHANASAIEAAHRAYPY